MKLRIVREDEFLPQELRFLELMQAKALHQYRRARAAQLAAKTQDEFGQAQEETKLAWGKLAALVRATVVYLERDMED